MANVPESNDATDEKTPGEALEDFRRSVKKDAKETRDVSTERPRAANSGRPDRGSAE
jgi:hypothetical protein